MLKTPISLLPTFTTLWLPSGNSETSPTTCSLRSCVIYLLAFPTLEVEAPALGVDLEETQGVLPEDLAPHLAGEGDLVHLHRVVEVVVGPVRGEDGRLLAVVEVDQGYEVVQVLRLLDGLGGVEEFLHVVAGTLLEDGDLPPALQVLLVHPVHQEGDPRDADLGEGDS